MTTNTGKALDAPDAIFAQDDPALFIIENGKLSFNPKAMNGGLIADLLATAKQRGIEEGLSIAERELPKMILQYAKPLKQTSEATKSSCARYAATACRALKEGQADG